MEKLGKQLKFLSYIMRDGSGTVTCGSEWNENMDIPQVDNMKYLDNDTFNLTCLSLSQGTFIASNFNSFVVRLKRDTRPLRKKKYKKLPLTDTSVYIKSKNEK
jgi:hypothetical protein